jgi:hypothetical protein
MRQLNVYPASTFAFWPVLGLACLAVSACGSNGADNVPDAATTADTGTTMDAELAVDADQTVDTEPSAGPLDGGPVSARGIVVIHSDSHYQSSSVSFLDRDGNLVKDGCIDSGTKPGLSMTLSGDLALPTQMPPGAPVVIIDRQYSTLTWLDPSTCSPFQQMSVGTGFDSNPHDFVQLSNNKAYVPRYNPNSAATPTPLDFDDGNDVLIVDPSLAKIVGRIDLLPSTPAGVLPRADRALLIDGTVYLSTNAVDANFATYATGRILMIDPLTDQVVGTIDLPGVKNCGAMTYLPTEKKLLVACTGDYISADASAIVVLDASVSPPVVAATLPATSLGKQAFSNFTVAAFDSNTIFAVASGDFGDVPPDQLWVLAANGAPSSKIYQPTEAIALGSLLADPARSRLFVADGTKTNALLRVFERASGVFQETAQVKTNPRQKLAPRGLAWF